eukprot:2867588-Prorocentrum_lima.AAC.1
MASLLPSAAKGRRCVVVCLIIAVQSCRCSGAASLRNSMRIPSGPAALPDGTAAMLFVRWS